MRQYLKVILATAMLAMAGTAANAGNIVVHNKTSMPVWVTLYTVLKTQINSHGAIILPCG